MSRRDREVRSLELRGQQTFEDDELSARVIDDAVVVHAAVFPLVFDAGTLAARADNGLAPRRAALQAVLQEQRLLRARRSTRSCHASRRAAMQRRRHVSDHEGPPVIIDSLTITGLDSVRTGRDPSRPSRSASAPLWAHPTDIAERRLDQSRLRNAGYPRADVFPAISYADTVRIRAEVELDVVPGPRARFGTIAIQRTASRQIGQANGRPRSTAPSCCGCSVFRPATGTATARSTRSAASTTVGAYRHVGIEHRHDACVDRLCRRSCVDVREDFMHQVSLEVGWATLDCFRRRGRSTRDKNFLDEAWRLDLTGRLSKLGYGAPTQLDVDAAICATARLLDQDSVGSANVELLRRRDGPPADALSVAHWVPAFSALHRAARRVPGVSAHDALRWRRVGDADSATGMPLRLGYSLEYGTDAGGARACSAALFSRVQRQSQTDVQQREAPLGRERIVSAHAHRQPRRSASGYRAGAKFRGIGAVLRVGSVADVLQGDGRRALYHPLSRRVTLATRVRAGIITAVARSGDSSLPPPQERLYAGGATSVRGFQQNALGPLVYLVDSAVHRIDPLTIPTTRRSRCSPRPAPRRRCDVIPTGGNRLVVFNRGAPNSRSVLSRASASTCRSSMPASARHERATQVSTSTAVRDPGVWRSLLLAGRAHPGQCGVQPVEAGAGRRTGRRPVGGHQAPLICVTAPGTTRCPRSARPTDHDRENRPPTARTSFVPSRGIVFSTVCLHVSIGDILVLR